MKNCYSDLDKILQHYGYSFDDVYAENIYTTDMREFECVSGYSTSLYSKHFRTGTWVEVKGLALPGQLIQIGMEARSATSSNYPTECTSFSHISQKIYSSKSKQRK
jgi:enamine deaminase RidA (YjgF/YER057c/UK114 family)